MTAFPHLLSPVVTDPKEGAGCLNWDRGRDGKTAIAKMSKMASQHRGYNGRVKEALARARVSRTVQDWFDG